METNASLYQQATITSKYLIKKQKINNPNPVRPSQSDDPFFEKLKPSVYPPA